MLNVRLKKEGGFTLIELLIVVVIIGILAAVAVPMYTRYITSAKAAEAPTQLSALVQYVQSYIRAHPTDWSDANMLLVDGTDHTSSDGSWVEEITGGNANHYFTYMYDENGGTGGAPALIATGANSPFDGDDTLIVTLDVNGNTTWVGANNLLDVMP